MNPYGVRACQWFSLPLMVNRQTRHPGQSTSISNKTQTLSLLIQIVSLENTHPCRAYHPNPPPSPIDRAWTELVKIVRGKRKLCMQRRLPRTLPSLAAGPAQVQVEHLAGSHLPTSLLVVRSRYLHRTSSPRSWLMNTSACAVPIRTITYSR